MSKGPRAKSKEQRAHIEVRVPGINRLDHPLQPQSPAGKSDVGFDILHIGLYSVVQIGDAKMKTINFTDFRNRASDMMTAVEHGETLLVVRHGRPIAEVSPATDQQPSWKRPALRLATKGSGLAAAIIEEREREALP